MLNVLLMAIQHFLGTKCRLTADLFTNHRIINLEYRIVRLLQNKTMTKYLRFRKLNNFKNTLTKTLAFI